MLPINRTKATITKTALKVITGLGDKIKAFIDN